MCGGVYLIVGLMGTLGVSQQAAIGYYGRAKPVPHSTVIYTFKRGVVAVAVLNCCEPSFHLPKSIIISEAWKNFRH